MTVRNKGLSSQQALKWDSHARLAQVVGGGVDESYLYDEGGQRVRKKDNPSGVSTFYPFGGYEQTSGLVTKHYSFGGRFVAVRGPAGLSFLFQDQLSSTIYATNAGGGKQAERGYYTFGGLRFSEGTMPTEYHFTGQREDGTGLYYYNSRFYDPQIGQFTSPDTIVPNPTRFMDYNRYLYAAGNPVKYNDPTGHCASYEDGSRNLEDDADCWSYVDQIIKLWNDDPDYWDGLFKDQGNWRKHLAGNSFFDKEWMFDQYETYLGSNSFRQTHNRQQAERALLPTQKLTYGPGPCEIWDCHALGLDLSSLGLSAVQTAGVVCTSFTGPVCGTVGTAATWGDVAVTAASVEYTYELYAKGEASDLDISIVTATASVSLVPGAGIVTGFTSLGWDALDPLIPDEEWWGPKGAK